MYRTISTDQKISFTLPKRFLKFSPSHPFPHPIPSLPLEVGPLTEARKSGGALQAPQQGLGQRPAEIEFGAF